MIERIIENWLINTNERSYELPFCQCLISKGYTILGLSFHGPLEQGKDIIAHDPDGKPCAFQLKSGNISEASWRNIKGEVDELVEIPIKHPKINPKVIHRAILVTNGEINDVVKANITDRNIRFEQLGLPKLEIIASQELLKMFIDVSGSFLPSKISDFKAFLELMTLDGHESLAKRRYSAFIESILLKESNSPVEQSRIVASSILLAQYSLAPYEECKNHIAIVEGWTILLSYVLSLVEKSEFKTDFSQSNRLIRARINSELDFLKDEFFSKEKHVESWDFDRLYQLRNTIVLGWLSARELFKFRVNPKCAPDDVIYSRIKKIYGIQTWFWGESATPFFLMFSLLAEKKGDRAFSIKILTDIVVEIITLNSFREKNSIPDPYYSAERILNHYFGPKSAKIDLSSFSGRSYHLSTLVDFLVRRNKRDILTELWKGISQVMNSQFKPSFAWESFKWFCEEGTQIDVFYNNPQSWKQLMDFASKSAEEPKMLMDNPFSLYFLLCYPHRLNPNTAKLIDQ